MIAEPAVGLVWADNPQCAEVQMFQQLWWQDAGQQIARGVDLADEPAGVGVVAVLRVISVHALIVEITPPCFQRNRCKIAT